MAKNLVIVESPTKARTIERFLGRNYAVRACLGHIRDLPKSKLGLDLEHDFAPQYVVPKEKRELLKNLKAQARDASAVYLATDPDREGEAIAWHLAEAMDLGGRQVRRVEFHEVTSSAVLAAVKNPREIDLQRVDAQQARRVLDRLVGYQLSPLLWKKVRRGLSAGRVQSVAVRLVVEREREIQAFVPVEYWTIEADLAKQDGKAAKREHFLAALVARRGQKIELHTQAEADAVLAALDGAAYRVANIREREQTRNPAAPFTTSTLQQEASRKLGYSAKRTMVVAQQLYEGLDIGGESVGLITYMRTDSTQVAESAQAEARQFIRERYGEDRVPPQPRTYRTRSRLAQEAHEAIRPTSVFREPAALKSRLTSEQFRLYELIWKRFVASQMASALFDVTTVEVEATPPAADDRFLFRATGSRLKFPGFLSIYTEGKDDAAIDDEDRKPLPALAQGEPLDLLELLPEQHFTEPPPRYSEATLVKAMEERGIGRPSTYAPTLATIQERGYVERIEKRLHPTELGMLVNDLLVAHFGGVVDVDFTANMEEELDDVAQGRRPWAPVVREFYEPFHRQLEAAEHNVGRVKPPDEPTDELCEKCGRNMVIKLGRFGRFLACPGFPECRNAKSIQVKVGVACPQCAGDLVEKRTKSKRTFYGCANYPTCGWTSWNKPVPEPCPKCGGLQVEQGRERLRCLTCAPLPEPAARGNGRASGSDGRKTAASGTKASGSTTTAARRTASPSAAATSGRGRPRVASTTRGRGKASTAAKKGRAHTTKRAAGTGGGRS